MGERLAHRVYKDSADFFNDMKQLVINTIVFFGPKAPESKLAFNLWAIFFKLIDKKFRFKRISKHDFIQLATTTESSSAGQLVSSSDDKSHDGDEDDKSAANNINNNSSNINNNNNNGSSSTLLLTPLSFTSTSSASSTMSTVTGTPDSSSALPDFVGTSSFAVPEDNTHNSIIIINNNHELNNSDNNVNNDVDSNNNDINNNENSETSHMNIDTTESSTANNSLDKNDSSSTTELNELPTLNTLNGIAAPIPVIINPMFTSLTFSPISEPALPSSSSSTAAEAITTPFYLLNSFSFLSDKTTSAIFSPIRETYSEINSSKPNRIFELVLSASSNNNNTNTNTNNNNTHQLTSSSSSSGSRSNTAEMDTRTCCLCFEIGDSPDFVCGRLHYVKEFGWCHINCAFWSSQNIYMKDTILDFSLIFTKSQSQVN